MTIAEFTDPEKASLNARIAEIASQWPTLDRAIACVNCRGLMASADEHGRCRHCRSESLFDAAALLNAEKA
jgi:hypothetical protein